MANMNIFGKDWMDMIFKGRNKEYGAYELRKKSGRHTLLALFLGVFFIGLAFGSKVLYDQFGDMIAKKKADVEEIKAIEVELPVEDPEPPVEEVPEPEPEPEPEPADAQKNVQDEKQFTETEVKKDEEIDKSKEQKTSQDDFDDNTTSGREDSEGDKDKGNLKSEGDQTGKAEEKSEGKGTGDQASDENKIYHRTSQKAEPKNGMNSFFSEFKRKFRNLDMPSNVKTVSIRLKFVVEKDGSLSNIQALDNKYGVGDEAIRVLKSMPNWKPAQHNGKTVRSSFRLPIKMQVN